MFALGPSDIFGESGCVTCPAVTDIEERLGSGTLTINGIAMTTGSPERISGTLAGTLGIVAEGETLPRSDLAECKSDEHALELLRR